MANITMTQVTKMCRELADEIWGVELDVPVKLNNRLSKAMGRFKVTRQGQSIEFAGKLLKEYPLDEVKSVVKHELTHYVLYNKGEPWRDGQPHFEKELKRIGATSNFGENRLKARGTYELVELECCNCGGYAGRQTPRKATNLVNKSMKGGIVSMCCHSRIKKGRVVTREYK